MLCSGDYTTRGMNDDAVHRWPNHCSLLAYTYSYLDYGTALATPSATTKRSSRSTTRLTIDPGNAEAEEEHPISHGTHRRREAVPVADTAAHEHRRTVERDFDSRVDEWRTIYDGRSFHVRRDSRALERTIAIIEGLHDTPDARALDIGCGAGNCSTAMRKRGTPHTAPTSRSAWPTRRVPRWCDASPLVQSSADALRTARRIPLVSALGADRIHPRPARALEEMARVLAPGGTLFVTAPNPVRMGWGTCSTPSA